jgi:predicted acetyltransferase
VPDSDLHLELADSYTAANSPWGVRAWRYHMVAGGTPVGTISLRDGHTRVYTHLLGHIGFSVDEAHRGNGYAGRAVLLLLPDVARLRIDTAWITTTPENAACRRTLERIGCEFVEAVDIPPYYETYRRGERTKLRYRLALPDMADMAALPLT